MNFLWKYGKSDIADCYLVRKKVFVEEQGFDGEAEFDTLDSVSHHLLITQNNIPIATARLFLAEDGFHCGRICVLKECRKTGIGLVIMQKLEEKAISLGADSLSLSAQIRAAGFYEKAGYTKYGEEYLDESCPHIAMKKSFAD